MNKGQTGLKSRAAILPGGGEGVRSVKSDIVFGTPSASCAGVGICKVLASGSENPCGCPRVSALMSMDAEGNLRIRFAKHTMENRFMKRHFRWLLFQVMEAYELPAELLQKIQNNRERRWIQPGIYSVWETKEWLIVDF
jgi:hypothetical protein